MKISQHQTFFSTPYGVIDWPRNRRSSGRSQQAVPFGPWTVGRGVTKRNSPPETTEHKTKFQHRNMVYLPPRPRSDFGFTFKACAEGRCRCEAGATKGISLARAQDQQHPARTDILFNSTLCRIGRLGVLRSRLARLCAICKFLGLAQAQWQSAQIASLIRARLSPLSPSTAARERTLRDRRFGPNLPTR